MLVEACILATITTTLKTECCLKITSDYWTLYTGCPKIFFETLKKIIIFGLRSFDSLIFVFKLGQLDIPSCSRIAALNYHFVKLLLGHPVQCTLCKG